jgi:hypothetical protein
MNLPDLPPNSSSGMRARPADRASTPGNGSELPRRKRRRPTTRHGRSSRRLNRRRTTISLIACGFDANLPKAPGQGNGSPADPSPTGPSDPSARPARCRSLDGEPLRAVSRVLPAALLRSSDRNLQGNRPGRVGRHTPAWPGSASTASADHWWRRGHTAPPRNIFDRFRNWPKTYSDFAFWEALFLGISGCHQPWPQTILFGRMPDHHITPRLV